MARLAVSTCRAELCPYWPGEGCLSGVMPCDEATAPPVGDSELCWPEYADSLSTPVIRELYEAARDLVSRHGEHDGPCGSAGSESDEACPQHAAASAAREDRLRGALAAMTAELPAWQP